MSKPIEYVDPSDSPLNADGFIGTPPEYQNYANETDKPLEGEPDEDDEDADDDTPAEPQARTASTGSTTTASSTSSTPKPTAPSPSGE